jgi:hypothetical protein
LQKYGSLYGNRLNGSRVSVENPYRLSYAGYNEIFTGYPDPAVVWNKRRQNPNENILDFISQRQDYAGQVAVFTSWNLFDYIFNKPERRIYLNSGNQPIIHDSLSSTEILVNGIQANIMDAREPVRHDMLTFVAAKEYIQNKHPKVVYISFGETDEFAHHGNYDEYLHSIHMVDMYLEQLWYLLNKDPFYKGNTNLIVTTDHGRGDKESAWMRHNMFISGSKNTWLLTIGPAMQSQGEICCGDEFFSGQLAQTMARILGLNFAARHPVDEPIYSLIRH